MKKFVVMLACVLVLSCASCGPGGVLLLALVGGGGGGGKKKAGYTLTINSAYGEASPPAGVHRYAPNTFISATCGITPYPDVNPVSGTRYYYTGFNASGSGLPTSGPDTQLDFNITENTVITWNWDVQHRLDINISPINGGSVTAPPPLDNGYYSSGTILQLTASAASGYGFYQWSGDASGNTNPLTVTMNSYKNITAEFVVLPHADFTASQTVFYGGTANVTFSDASWGDIVQWDWDFNGDGIFDQTHYSSPGSVVWAYSTPGVYTVTLKVTGPAGHTDSKTETRYIKVYGSTIYVNVNTGDDTNNFGTSPTDALKTIQKGIDTAQDGMTVLVANGTYNEKNISFGGKAIVVKSENGAEYCIVDGGSSGRIFLFNNGETSASVLEG
ncbi:MAG: PKD domain-containing protein, partial [Planctomycetota bacterium]|nr:PKD domain-containing protein [Planctomycetota bacterium]